MSLLATIKQFDPNFPMKLERYLNSLNPSFLRAERSILNWLLGQSNPGDMAMVDAIAEIKMVMRQVPGFQVEISTDDEESEFRLISGFQIGAERFGYVQSVENKIVRLSRN